MSSTKVTTGAVALCMSLLAIGAGCAPVPEPSPTQTSSDPAPVETETTDPGPTTATCENLIDEATYAAFDADDTLELYTGDEVGGFPSLGGIDTDEFRDGVMCRWGIPNTDAAHDYSWAPIDSARATELRDQLEANGVAATETPEGTLYSGIDEASGATAEILFGDGFWVYTFNGITAAEVARNAPQG